MTRPRRDARAYVRSGEHIVAKAMPSLVERVTDPAVPESALSPMFFDVVTIRGEEEDP